MKTPVLVAIVYHRIVQYGAIARDDCHVIDRSRAKR